MSAHIIRIGISIILALLLRQASSKRIKVSLVFIIISLYLASLALSLIGQLVIFVPALIILLFIKYSADKTWHRISHISINILCIVYMIIQAGDLYMKVLISTSAQDIIFKFAVLLLVIFILVLNYEFSKKSENKNDHEE
jgi:hypothetical protein